MLWHFRSAVQERDTKDEEKSCKDNICRCCRLGGPRPRLQNSTAHCSSQEIWADALCVDERSGANHLVKARAG